MAPSFIPRELSDAAEISAMQELPFEARARNDKAQEEARKGGAK